MPLTIKRIINEKMKGRYSDGNNLYLQVSEGGSKSWVFRYRYSGKSYEMGLGALDIEQVPQARQKALEYLRMLRDDLNPIREKEALLAKKRLADAKVITFRECAEQFLSSHLSSWRNEKHKKQNIGCGDQQRQGAFSATP